MLIVNSPENGAERWPNSRPESLGVRWSEIQPTIFLSWFPFCTTYIYICLFILILWRNKRSNELMLIPQAKVTIIQNISYHVHYSITSRNVDSWIPMFAIILEQMPSFKWYTKYIYVCVCV